MTDLRAQLRACLTGRVCLVGLGNVDHGDDALGIRLAAAVQTPLTRTTAPSPCPLRWRGDSRSTAPEESAFRFPSSGGARGGCRSSPPRILLAGTTPEHWLAPLDAAAYDHVLFLDAVECGAAPGSVVLLDARTIAARFPQVSTHKLSLGLLAHSLTRHGQTQVWLLGVQPASLAPNPSLTRAVQRTVDTLARVLGELIRRTSRLPQQGRDKHRVQQPHPPRPQRDTTRAAATPPAEGNDFEFPSPGGARGGCRSAALRASGTPPANLALSPC